MDGWAFGTDEDGWSGVRVWGDGLFMWDLYKCRYIGLRYMIIRVFGVLLLGMVEGALFLRLRRRRRRDFGKGRRLTD